MIALVIVPAIKGARIVELSDDELAVMNAGIKASFRLPEDASIALPSPIVAVDTDGDRHADAAVVHGCYRTKGDQCIDTTDLFVRRVDAGWVVPYASPQ